MEVRSFFIDVDQDEGGNRLRNKDASEPYSSSKHLAKTRKFLYWKDEGLFLASNASVHRAVTDTATELGVSVPSGKPTGAGNVGQDERIEAQKGHQAVTDWRSLGFKVETPSEHRSEIKRLLGIPD